MKIFYRIFLSALLVLLSFNVNAFAEDTDIIVREIAGLVQVQKAGETAWAKAQDEMMLSSGDKIRSFLESSALLVFSDGSEFRLRENTSVDIKDISQNPFSKTAKRELKLNLGSLHYKVPPKKERATEFKIHSSTSIVGITGTEGIITARGGEKPSENILIEGATYNTNDAGVNGRYQTKGNVYIHDGKKATIFNADVDEEAAARLAIDNTYEKAIEEALALCRVKQDEAYKVDEVHKLLKQAFFYLEKRQYDLVQQTIQQAKQMLETAKKIGLPEDLDARIKKTIAQIKEKEAAGFDVAKAFALAGKVKELKQGGYFSEIKQIIPQIEKELAVLTEESAGTGKSFKTHFENAQKEVLEKAQQGYVLSEIKASLRQSQMYYEKGDAARAYLILDGVKGNLALALKTVSDALRVRIDRIQGDIALKKENGYPARELELKLEKIKILIKNEDFIKAREMASALEEGILTLTKNVSAEWKLKISNLKSDANYKRSIGYDLNQIYDVIADIEKYQAQGDLVNLDQSFQRVQESLKSLVLPAGFETNWNEFKKQMEAKKSSGFSIKDISDLNDKIKSAVDMGDIKTARSFLAQAQKLLTEMSDQEPPKVQILTYTEEDDLITIEGYANDNTKVRNVSVNNATVELAKDGKFTFKTVPLSTGKLVVLAEDIKGNISAPVTLVVSKAKAESQVDGSVTGAKIEYGENTFTVNGKFVSGAKVMVGAKEAVCDDKGRFTVMVKPDRSKPTESIAVAGVKSEGVMTEEVILTVEDKWAPKIKIDKVTFNNSFTPTLKVNPLAFDEKKMSVSGQVNIMQMANVEGRAHDLGSGLTSLNVDGLDVEVGEGGLFHASITLDPSRRDMTVKLIATDKAGNKTETKTALDAVWDLPVVKVNTNKTFLNSIGKFTKEIILTEELNDIVVALEDAKGQTVISKRLPVPDIFPPVLEIQDVRYKEGKVYVTGRTNADATVSDVNKIVFKEDIQTTRNATFTLSAQYPETLQEVVLTATNIEGKTSDEARLAVGPPRDTKAPVLYISSPQESNKEITIKGFIDDESDIKSLMIQGTPVTVSDRQSFSHTVAFTKDLTSIVVTAEDVFGNKTKKTIALKDKEPPVIDISTWTVQNGKLVIAGTVTDNIGVKEIRLNDMPIMRGNDAKLAFSYNGTLTEDSKDAVIVAVDLLNNEAKEGPRALEIPTDASAPAGKSIGIKYGSPIVYASGEVTDPAGVKAVYVNGEEVELFPDGTFNIKVSIDVGLPKIELESPAYDGGKVVIAGKAAAGDFKPAKIVVESEDLSGNRGVLFSQNVQPYKLNELQVTVNGEVVELDETGGFSYEQPIFLGQRSIEVKAQDPFDNVSAETQDLESVKPVLSLKPLEYDADAQAVILAGSASDEGSGLNTVSVNGIRVDVNADGSFNYTASFDQRSLNVIAADYIGNTATLTKEVNPPDIWPPVFELTFTPVPAIIGNPVYIEIAATDSNTGLPEMLKEAPTVIAQADGAPVSLSVAGEGSNYMATVDTAGLNAALVTVRVSGEDQAGNGSSEIEGDDAFVLVADDMIVPSFTIETIPSPLELGKTGQVKVYVSEDLKTDPTLQATLPSGAVSSLSLAGAGSGAYEASLTVTMEEGIGSVLLKLEGGEDLSGNVHETTETSVDIVAPTALAALPLNITTVDFLSNRFTLSGQTASEAVVHIEVGRMVRDIVADPQGMFRFERPVTLEELQEMYTRGPNIRVVLKAHNYAGFESPTKSFETALPPLPEFGGENFEIRLTPYHVGQGETLNINVEARRSVAETPRGFLYLPDGSRVAVNLQGRGVFTGQYFVPENVPLGPASFEVVSGNIREMVAFEIGLSNEWQQRLNKYDFFRIHTSRDPLIIGDPAEFYVETMGDVPGIPRLEIRLPDGRRDPIPLTGSMRSFKGSYMAPAGTLPGPAELILNPGMPQEVRRPYGVEDAFSMSEYMDVFLLVNPRPLISGEPYEVNVSFSRNVTFKPRLVLKTQTGRVIEMPLQGSAPSSRFSSRGTMPADLQTGLAKFKLFDDRGMVIDDFPVNITSALTTSEGVDIFIVPNMLHHLDMATVQLNSSKPIYEDLEVHISYPDGTKMVLPLDGSTVVKTARFSVPVHVPFGMMTATVYNERGVSLGTVNAQVTDYGVMGGPVRVFLDNPDFAPYDLVRVTVEADWPLPFVPKAEMFYNGSSMPISLTGRIPGNRFTGEFRAPSAAIEYGRIEVRDAGGRVIADFPLDIGPGGEGEVIVTPMPPRLGEPLSIKVIAPEVVNTLPVFRLKFQDGSTRDLNAYGPLPGKEFKASLASLDKYLSVIEIIHEGRVVESIAVDNLMTSSFAFYTDFSGEIDSCMITTVKLGSDSYIPFVPYMNADIAGQIIDIPLSRMSPQEFYGNLSVPCGISFTSFSLRVFDPNRKLLWQRAYTHDDAAGLLSLNVYPKDNNSVELVWNMLPGIENYEIRYGSTTALGQTLYARNVSNYTVTGLTNGMTYFFKVAARKDYQDIMVSDIIQVIVGGTTMELSVTDSVMDNDIQLSWSEYAGAESYRVQWGVAPGAYTNMMDTVNNNYFINDLARGSYYYIKVQAMDGPTVIGESREIISYISPFVSSGGEIYFYPDQPVQGSYLEINVHFFNDLPYMPQIVLRLQNRDEYLPVTGSGRDFEAFITGSAFDSPLLVVDILDPDDNIIASRPVSGSAGDSGIVIYLTPAEPMIANGFDVRVEFNTPPPYIPRLFVEYASGEREYFFPQGASQNAYFLWIPAADVTSSVMEVRIEDNNGNVLRVISFDNYVDGYADAPFQVNPNPPMLNQPVSITLQTDFMVSLRPKLRIYFASGTQEITMFGAVPGQNFAYDIGSLNSIIHLIEILDPVTNTVKHTWYPGEADVMNCQILEPDYDPVKNVLLPIRVSFPDPVAFVPKVYVYMDDNNTIAPAFPSTVGVSTFYTTVAAGSITDNVNRIQVLDDEYVMTLCERSYSAGAMEPLEVRWINVTPATPTSTDEINIEVNFNEVPAFVPRWKLLTTGTGTEGDLYGDGGTYYTATVYPGNWTGTPTEIEIWHDGAFVPNGQYDFTAAGEVTVTGLTVTPMSPTSTDEINIEACFNVLPGFTPRWALLATGTGNDGTLYFDAGTCYTATIYPGNWTGTAEEIAILDDGNNPIPNGIFDFDISQTFTCSATVTFDAIRSSATEMTVTANYAVGNEPSYVPYVYFEFAGGGSDSKIMNGAPYQSEYSVTVYSSDLPNGYYIGDIVLVDVTESSSGGTVDCGQDFAAENITLVDLYTSPDPPPAPEDDVGFFVYVDFSGPTPFEPEISVTFNNNGTYTTEYYYPGYSQSSSYSIWVDVADVVGEVDKVQVQDAADNVLGEITDFNYGTVGVNTPTGYAVIQTGTLGELKVTWTSDSQVDGYYIYYGTSESSYTTNKVQIPVYTTTEKVLTSLISTDQYWFAMTSYIGETESSFTPVFGDGIYPAGGGGGLLEASPTTLNWSGNAGSTITGENVTITNNRAPTANVKVYAEMLYSGGHTIPLSSYNIDGSDYNASYYKTVDGGGSTTTFSVGLDVPAGAESGTYNGILKFYADDVSNNYIDGSEPFAEVTVQVTIGSALTVSYFTLDASDTSSEITNPIFMTIKAKDSGGTLVDTYNGPVIISASESAGGLIPESWWLSPNGGPGGVDATVTMFNGIGNFTVDALEPETLTVTVDDLGNPYKILEFLPQDGGDVDGFAIIGPNRVPTGAGGTTVWVAAVDADGKVVTDYDLSVNFTAVGDGANTPVLSQSSYNFTLADKGQVQLTISDVNSEKVTLTASYTALTGTLDIDFVGVDSYVVYKGTTSGTTFDGHEDPVLFTLRANNLVDGLVRSYNETAVVASISDLTSSDASFTAGTFTFEDGIAEATLTNSFSGLETVTFEIEEQGGGMPTTGTITVNYSSDATPPEITRVEMDTPWIAHIYFSEDVHSETARVKNNYNVGPGWGSTIHTVCWYGDNVTLHLSSIPGLGLGESFNLQVRNVRDSSNAVWVAYPSAEGTAVSYSNISIPNVDYQGGALSGGDWFEVQASNSNPADGETVHITVYHKNVCGYLTGSNRDNAHNTSVGSVSITYQLNGTASIDSPVNSLDLSDGQDEFDIVVRKGATGGSIQITASDATATADGGITLNLP